MSVKSALQEDYKAELSRLNQCGEPVSTGDLQKRHFARYDALLAQCAYGNVYLKQPVIAQIVVASLTHWDNTRIDLIAYCVMPNHVHVVFRILGNLAGEDYALADLMRSIKSFSARKANTTLGLTGKFWAEESHDRLVRDDDELIRIVRYVLSNPVKANLCTDWREWPWSYVKTEYDMF